MNIHLFTSAACNYFPKAKMLARSVRKYHPEWILHIVVADLPSADTRSLRNFFDEIHPASEIGIPGFYSWAFRHSLVEFSTAVKPFFLEYLLRRNDVSGVIYLDPDIVVFSRLDEISDPPEPAPVILTPHLLQPESSVEGIMDHEMAALKHGIFNLGFLWVKSSETGRSFARWWAERTYHFCDSDTTKGLFTDQRWIDFVPVFFPETRVLRSVRFNVAPWNISSRKITGRIPDHLMVNEFPLGFYHFTGFDNGAHRLMLQKYAADQPVALDLADWYQAECSDFKNTDPASSSWGFGRFNDGSPVRPEMRLVYRSRPDLQSAFPDPFNTAGNSFIRWWKKQQVKNLAGNFLSGMGSKKNRP